MLSMVASDHLSKVVSIVSRHSRISFDEKMTISPLYDNHRTYYLKAHIQAHPDLNHALLAKLGHSSVEFRILQASRSRTSITETVSECSANP